jgi:enamine deaminase RidA (YjgF/YER057c/UK114 family)
MNEKLNPPGVHTPGGAYSHTVKVPPGATWLAIAGQVGVDPKGKLVAGFQRQAEQAFRNLVACLRAHKMGKQDLVKLTVFLTDPRNIEAYRAARRKVLGDDVLPASTLLIIDGLASPEMLIEIEGYAAKS